MRIGAVICTVQRGVVKVCLAEAHTSARLAGIPAFQKQIALSLLIFHFQSQQLPADSITAGFFSARKGYATCRLTFPNSISAVLKC